MKPWQVLFLNFTSNVVAMMCAGFAGYLAIKQIEGWGWFLICAVIAATTVQYKAHGTEVNTDN